MIFFATTLLLPSLVVLLWLRRVGVAAHSTILAIGLSMGLGLGLASCLHYLWLAIPGAKAIPFWLADTIPWCLFAVAALGVNRDAAPSRVARAGLTHKTSPLLAASVGILAACVVFALLVQQAQYPFGTDDALSMWNIHARVLYLDPHWQEFFSGVTGFDPHKDYPLLIPATIARLWTAWGRPSGFVSGGVSLWFSAATVLVVYGAVAAWRGRNQALLSVLALLGTSYFVKLGGNQLADIPLSFFITAALVLALLNAQVQPRSAWWQGLAGLSAGLAAWTKNEGLLFVVALLTAQAILAIQHRTFRRYWHEAWPLLIGAAVVLLLVVSFKITARHPNDLAAGQSLATVMPRVLDPSRYGVILTGVARETLGIGKGMILVLPVYFLLMGRSRQFSRNPGLRWVALSVTLVALGYCAVYLVTPNPLAWHVSTSAGRLALHLWPTLLVIFFLCVSAPDEFQESQIRTPGLRAAFQAPEKTLAD